MAEISQSIPPFLDRVLEFPNGHSYELLAPLTDLRACHDGVPAESRILFICKQVQPPRSQGDQQELVMKIKIQRPGDLPNTGPSTTTAAELKALEHFTKAQSMQTPHLVTWKGAVQGSNGLLPDGYLTYTVMRKMPGQNLLDLQYWDMPSEEREEIQQKFLQALRSIYALGIELIDRALRNVMWERETRQCSIVDFELWNETDVKIKDETRELQRWGLARQPPARSWWDAWNLQER